MNTCVVELSPSRPTRRRVLTIEPESRVDLGAADRLTIEIEETYAEPERDPNGAVHRAEHLEVLASALASVSGRSRLEIVRVQERKLHPIPRLVSWISHEAQDSHAAPRSARRGGLLEFARRALKLGPSGSAEGVAEATAVERVAEACLPSDWSRLSRRDGGYSFFVALGLVALCLVPASLASSSRVLADDRSHRRPGDSELVAPLDPNDPFGVPSTMRPDLSGAWNEPITTDVAADTITFKITSGNNLGLTLFNDGFFGNNFANRQPSFEYPLGSNIDHMVRGGLWVGAITAEGDTLVTTATKDGQIGSRGLDSEFFPTTATITELSILPNSRYFSRDARSEQDFHLSYSDARPRRIGDEDHKPLNLKVDLETLLYSFEPFDAIVIANMKIINTHPTDALFNVELGFYSELASGYKDPAATNPFSGWFRQKDIAYVDSLRMMSEHHYNLDGGQAPSWGGIVLLGTRPVATSALQVAFNWWNWNTSESPSTDVERYRTMSNGSIDATGGVEAPNNDPVEMISVGPIPILEAGDTLTVSWAFVGGELDRRTGRTAEQDLAFNAGWAQTAFDLNFNIPVPPPAPELKVIPGHGKVTLRWKDDPERFIDPKSRKEDFEGYRVYISEDRVESEFRRVREADIVDSVFYNTGLEALVDPVTIDGESYRYRYDIDGLKDGFKYWVSVTAFDSGTPDIGSLESGLSQNRTFVIPGTPAFGQGGEETVKVFPNPYRGDAAWDGSLRRDRYLWFVNLPPRCTIRIYTLAGDLVDTIPFDQSTYDATEIRGIFDPTDVRNPEGDIPTLSGGMAAWDLVTRSDQGVASGLYVFSVQNKDTGKTQFGKFLILK